MSYSQKYTLVQFFEQMDENETFRMSEWPLHITLADVFAVDVTNELIQDIQQYTDTRPTAATYVKDEATLDTTAVWLIEDTPNLNSIHTSLIAILEKHNAIFDRPEFTREGFIPHITKQPERGMEIGDKVIVSVVSLIDMFPDQNWQMRKVLKRFIPEIK